MQFYNSELSHRLTVSLDEAPGTELDFTASFTDFVGSTPTLRGHHGATDGTTPVDIVPMPGLGADRWLRGLTLHNPNGSSVDVTFEYRDASEARVVLQVSLIAGGTLQWLDKSGWIVPSEPA